MDTQSVLLVKIKKKVEAETDRKKKIKREEME